MATDFKKIGFQYGDKIILGVFLALFVLSALSSFKPYSPPLAPGYGRPKDGIAETIKAEDKVYSDLRKPPIPAGITIGGFATDPDELTPGEGFKQCPECSLIVPEDAGNCPGCQHPFVDDIIIVDSDGDKIPDEWEKRYADYADRQVADAGRDDDADGFDNFQEYMGESHPGDAKSIPVPITVTAIKERRVDILFAGYSRTKDRYKGYWLQINWGRKVEVTFIKAGDTFRGYKFSEPSRVEITEDGKKKEKIAVKIQKMDMETNAPVSDKKWLLHGEYVPEDELSASLQIVRGPEQGKKLIDKYVQDEVDVDGKIYRIQSIEKNHLKLVELDSGNIITLYVKSK
jgi:RNA polymerase subunit RPABC4/transcription elongation factor Spt4